MRRIVTRNKKVVRREEDLYEKPERAERIIHTKPYRYETEKRDYSKRFQDELEWKDERRERRMKEEADLKRKKSKWLKS